MIHSRIQTIKDSQCKSWYFPLSHYAFLLTLPNLGVLYSFVWGWLQISQDYFHLTQWLTFCCMTRGILFLEGMEQYIIIDIITQLSDKQWKLFSEMINIHIMQYDTKYKALLSWHRIILFFVFISLPYCLRIILLIKSRIYKMTWARLQYTRPLMFTFLKKWSNFSY